MSLEMLRLIGEQRIINKELDRRKPVTAPSVFVNNAQRPAARDNGGRIIFVKQADGSFQGQYSDGTNWQTIQTSAASFATPAITYATMFGDGIASTVIRSDAQLKFPQALMSLANAATLTLTDDAVDMTLANSLGILNINTPTLRMPPPTVTATNRMIVNLDPDFNNVGILSNWTAGSIASKTVSCWDATFNSMAGIWTSATIIGFDQGTATLAPTAGSGGGNIYYGIRTRGTISNTNATWSEVAAAYFAGVRRSIGSPTITTQPAVIIEPPTAATSDQIGLLIRQQTAQATATNRFGIDILTQNSGTNRWSLRAADRVEVQSQAAQATTALLLRQLSTGATAGAHINFDDKAGDPPAPVTGDLWRNGDGLWFRQSASSVNLTSAAAGGDNITVNAAGVVDADFDDATPAPLASPLGDGLNVKWQKDASSPANISAYVNRSAFLGLIEASAHNFNFV